MGQFVVDSNSLKSYNTMRAMSTALPSSIQWIKITFQVQYLDSDSDSDFDTVLSVDEEAINYLVDAIDILPNFTKLRRLEIESSRSWSSYSCPLSGRCPALSNFPLLQTLKLSCGWHLNLEMLSALPLLRELELSVNLTLTGNLSSLRALKGTLEKIIIGTEIEGDFMTLADFPRLKELDLGYGVTGDIRDIRLHDFPALESLRLPSTVHGGTRYEFQRISDVPSFMQALHFLLRRTPTLLKDYHIDSHDWIMDAGLRWSLSKDSPDWYDRDDWWDDWSGRPSPPFNLQLIRKGSRLGWSWFGYINQDLWDYFERRDQSCEINWLDPESMQHENVERFDETYIWPLGDVEISFFSGYNEPPNELQFRRLFEG